MHRYDRVINQYLSGIIRINLDNSGLIPINQKRLSGFQIEHACLAVGIDFHNDIIVRRKHSLNDFSVIPGYIDANIINAQTVPTDLYGITGIPCIMLIGPDGTILSRDKQGEDLVADVEKYIKK